MAAGIVAVAAVEDLAGLRGVGEIGHGPGVDLFGHLEVALLGLIVRAHEGSPLIFPGSRGGVGGAVGGRYVVEEHGGDDGGEIDARHLAVAGKVGLGLVDRLPLPEHAASEPQRGVGIRAGVAYAGRAVPHACEALLGQGAVALVAGGLVGACQGDGPPLDVVVDEPSAVGVGVVEVKIQVMPDVSFEELLCEVGVALGADGVALAAGERCGVDGHVHVHRLAPDGGGSLVASEGAAVAVGILVDVFVSVEIDVVEGIVGGPYVADSGRGDVG